MKEYTQKYGNSFVKRISVEIGNYYIKADVVLDKIEEAKKLGFPINTIRIEGESGGYDDDVQLMLKAERTLEGEELAQAQKAHEEEQNKHKTEIELRERAQLEALKAKYENSSNSKNT